MHKVTEILLLHLLLAKSTDSGQAAKSWGKHTLKKREKVLYMLQCSKTNDILSDHLLWYVTTSSSMEIFVRWRLLSASTWQAVCWLHFLTHIVKRVYEVTSVCCDQLFLDLFNTELLLQRYWQGLRMREGSVCVWGGGGGNYTQHYIVTTRTILH